MADARAAAKGCAWGGVGAGCASACACESRYALPEDNGVLRRAATSAICAHVCSSAAGLQLPRGPAPERPPPRGCLYCTAVPPATPATQRTSLGPNANQCCGENPPTVPGRRLPPAVVLQQWLPPRPGCRSRAHTAAPAAVQGALINLMRWPSVYVWERLPVIGFSADVCSSAAVVCVPVSELINS